MIRKKSQFIVKQVSANKKECKLIFQAFYLIAFERTLQGKPLISQSLANILSST